MLEISFDDSDRKEEFVTGCYRVDGSEWRVFQFAPLPHEVLRKTHVEPRPATWRTGTTGVSFDVPDSFTFGIEEMKTQLSSWLQQEQCQIVRGPESRTLTNPVPDCCNVCGHDEFDIVGRVGHYEGTSGGGDIYAATCRNCDTSWVARFGGDPTPWNIAEDRWWDCKDV